jgi:hypothetical protein
MAPIARSLQPPLVVLAFLGLVLDAPAKVGPGPRAARAPMAAGPQTYGPGEVYASIPAKDEFGRDQLAMFREWNPDPVGNHEAFLAALDPLLAKVIRKAQAENPELRFVVGSGRRSAALQRKAFAWGWSRTRGSLHQSGKAVDLWPLDDEGHVQFDAAIQNRVGAAMRKAAAELNVRIRWGGKFHSFRRLDRSHFELARR